MKQINGLTITTRNMSCSFKCATLRLLCYTVVDTVLEIRRCLNCRTFLMELKRPKRHFLTSCKRYERLPPSQKYAKRFFESQKRRWIFPLHVTTAV